MGTEKNSPGSKKLGNQGKFCFKEKVKYLSQLNGKYWGFRRRVPNTLRAAVGKREIWRTHNSTHFLFSRIRHARELRVFENYFKSFGFKNFPKELPDVPSLIEKNGEIYLDVVRARLVKNTGTALSKTEIAIMRFDRIKNLEMQGAIHVIRKALCSDDEILESEENYIIHAEDFISSFLVSAATSKDGLSEYSNSILALELVSKKDLSLLNVLFRGIAEWRISG